MKILKWKKGKKNTYILCLENHQEISLYEEIVLKNELLFLKDITEKQIEEVVKENDLFESYYVALSYLNKKMRSQLEVEKYLKQKMFPKETRKNTVERLKKEGYINDEKFTQAYIHDAILLKLDGPLKIERDLEKLGISNWEALAEVPQEVWKKKVEKLIQKRVSMHKNESRAYFKKKLVDYLYLHGYSKEFATPFIENLKLENNERALQKQKDLLMKKYISKYPIEKAKWFVKQKLYQKGFTEEEITKVFSE